MGTLFGGRDETDGALVQRFAQDQDGEAFSIIVGRYGDMVYTTCYRILRQEAQASDAVQETFLQLARSAARIQGSVGCWLHRVATRRAVDLIRQDASRRHREHHYALDAETGASTWSEVESAVDSALDELPDDLRELLVQHFLQGRSTVQIAAAQGLSQPTISRRIHEALESMREMLRGQGIQVATAPLQTLLLHSSRAVPLAVRAGLGKIALAKAVVAHSSTVAPGAVASALAVKTAVTVAAVTLATGAAWVAHRELRPPPPATAPAVVRQAPKAPLPWVPPTQTAIATYPPTILLPGPPPTTRPDAARAGRLMRPGPAKEIPRPKTSQPGLLAAKKSASGPTNASLAALAPLARDRSPDVWSYEPEGAHPAVTNLPAAFASQHVLVPNLLPAPGDVAWFNFPGTNGLAEPRGSSARPWSNAREATNYSPVGPLVLNPFAAPILPSSAPPAWYPLPVSPPVSASALPARNLAPNRPKLPQQ